MWPKFRNAFTKAIAAATCLKSGLGARGSGLGSARAIAVPSPESRTPSPVIARVSATCS